MERPKKEKLLLQEIFVLVLSDPHTCCRNFKPIAVFGRDRVWCETINQQTAFQVRCCHRPPKLPPLRTAQRKRGKRPAEDRPLKVVSGQQQYPNRGDWTKSSISD